jgi:hypothetical protein
VCTPRMSCVFAVVVFIYIYRYSEHHRVLSMYPHPPPLVLDATSSERHEPESSFVTRARRKPQAHIVNNRCHAV